MKNSKKIILLSVLGLVLGACGSVTDSSEKDSAVNSSSRESISIKDLAIEPEYGQMYHEELDVGTHIHIVGELGEIPEAPEHATFLMGALSKDGTGISFYNIENYTPNNSEFKFSKNDMVDVWGIYQGNDEEKGTPIIRAFVIETNHTAKRVSEAINEIVNKTDDNSIEAPSGNYTKTETYNDAINITSRDYNEAIVKWISAIEENGGIRSLGKVIGNYPPAEPDAGITLRPWETRVYHRN